ETIVSKSQGALPKITHLGDFAHDRIGEAQERQKYPREARDVERSRCGRSYRGHHLLRRDEMAGEVEGREAVELVAVTRQNLESSAKVREVGPGMADARGAEHGDLSLPGFAQDDLVEP